MILLLVLACQPPEPILLGPPDTGGDTAGVPPGDPALCGPWSGFAGLGTRWAYVVSEPGATGTEGIEVTEVAGDTFRTTEHTEIVASDGSFSSTEERGRVWACTEAGLVVYEDDLAVTTLTGPGEPVVQTRRLVYDPPALWVPAALKPGDTWTVPLQGVVVIDGVGQDFSWEARYEALAAARIEVPAGGFDTIEVLGSWESNAGTVLDHRFLAAGVGAVRHSERFALANYDAGR